MGSRSQANVRGVNQYYSPSLKMGVFMQISVRIGGWFLREIKSIISSIFFLLSFSVQCSHVAL